MVKRPAQAHTVFARWPRGRHDRNPNGNP